MFHVPDHRNTWPIWLLFHVVVLTAWQAAALAGEMTVKTSTGKGADAEVRENANNSGHDAGRGDNDQINVRYFPEAGNERNEVVLLRFDLTGVNPDEITDAQLDLTSYRVQPASKGLQIYALKPTAKNQNWDEYNTRFSTAPGLKWDDDFSTRGLVEEDTVSLGLMPFPAVEEGTVLTFKSDALNAFLKDKAWSQRADDPNLVTFLLLMDQTSNNQRRIRSKEFMDEDDKDAPRLILQTTGSQAPSEESSKDSQANENPDAN